MIMKQSIRESRTSLKSHNMELSRARISRCLAVYVMKNLRMKLGLGKHLANTYSIMTV